MSHAIIKQGKNIFSTYFRNEKKKKKWANLSDANGKPSCAIHYQLNKDLPLNSVNSLVYLLNNWLHRTDLSQRSKIYKENGQGSILSHILLSDWFVFHLRGSFFSPIYVAYFRRHLFTKPETFLAFLSKSNCPIWLLFRHGNSLSRNLCLGIVKQKAIIKIRSVNVRITRTTWLKP